MQLKLKVVGGARDGQVVPVNGPKFLIGRASDCHLRPTSDAISRHHCAIVREGDSLVICDLGSRNGTYVNDQRIEGQHVLTAGDEIRVGPLQFVVELVKKSGVGKRPKVRDVGDAMDRTANSNSPEDWDVSSWLEDDEEPPPRPRTTEPTDDTATIAMEDTSATVLPPSGDGKPAGSTSAGGASGMEAAAEALRKYYSRRRR